MLPKLWKSSLEWVSYLFLLLRWTNMIITDGIHVVSTASLEELHDWAKRNGVGDWWFRGTRKGHPHYDLPSTRRFLLYNLERQGCLRSSREILLAAKAIHKGTHEQQQLP